MSRIKENRGGNKVKRPVPAMPPIKGQREYGVVVQKVLRGEAEVGNKVVVIAIAYDGTRSG